MDDDLLWLIKWFHTARISRFKLRQELGKSDDNEEHELILSTLDNPGWRLNIDLHGTDLEHQAHKPTRDVHGAEHDWIAVMKRNGRFEAYGGPFNLPQLLKAFRFWVERGNDRIEYHPLNVEWTHLTHQPPGYQQRMQQVQDNMAWLATWYYSQCDGDWEHQYGVHIYNHDAQDWCFRVSLKWTAMEDQPFKNISIQRSETDWLRCAVEREPAYITFEGFGGPFNLPEIIQIFRQWAQSIYDRYPVDPHHLIP